MHYLKQKKGQMNVIQGLALGIGGVIIVASLVAVVISKLNSTVNDPAVSSIVATGQTNLGTNGLMGWIGVVIVVVIAGILMYYFMGTGGKRKV